MASDPWAVVSSESADPWAVVGQDEGDTGNATLFDYGNMLTRGLAGATGAVGQGVEFVGEATGIDAIAKAGRKTREDAAERQRILTSYMTPGARQRRDNQVVVEKPGSAPPPMELGKGRAWFDNLEFGPTPVSSALLQSVESLPGMAATMAVGGPMSAGLKKIGGEALKKVAAKEGAVGAVAKVAPTAVGYGAAEGAFAGLQNASQIRGEIEKIPVERLRGVPAFDAEVAATDSALPIQERELLARNEIARKASVDVATRTALSTGLIGMATGGGALGAIHRGAGAPVKDGIIKSTIKGAASEAPQETMQSGAEAYISNLATQKYIDPSINPMEGVVGQAVSGGIVGAATGGVFGAGGVMIPSRSRTSNGWDVVRETPDANAPDIDDQDLVDQINMIMSKASTPEAGAFATPLIIPEESKISPEEEIELSARLREQDAKIPASSAPSGLPGGGSIQSLGGSAYSSGDILSAKTGINQLLDKIEVEPSSFFGDMQPGGSKISADSGATAAKNLADLLERKPAIFQSLSSQDINTQKFVLKNMRRAAQDDQVFNSIVQLIPVDMMDNFVSGQIMSDVALHDMAVFKDLPSGDSDLSVPIAIDVAGRIAEAMAAAARFRAEPSLPDLQLVRGGKKPFPAKGAGDGDARPFGKTLAPPGTEQVPAIGSLQAGGYNPEFSQAYGTIDDRHNVTPYSNVGLGTEAADTVPVPPIISREAPTGDRRTDAATRKRVSEMTPEEMRASLLTSDLTGLGNRRAYEEAKKLPVQASIDADSLKWVNDNLSPDSGDKLLQAIGQALKDEGADAYHISGDEYMVQGTDEAQIDTIMERVQDRLKSAVIRVEKPDGTIIEKRGLEVTYGTGKDKSEADYSLKQRKVEREKSGLRAGRGEQPPGVSKIPPTGKQDTERGITGEVDQQTPEKDSAIPDAIAKMADSMAKMADAVDKVNSKVDAIGKESAPSLTKPESKEKNGDVSTKQEKVSASQNKDSNADLLTEQAPKHQTKDALKSYLRGRLGKAKANELIESGAVDRAWDGRDGAPLFSRGSVQAPVLDHDAVEAIASGIFKKLGLGRNLNLAVHQSESTLPPEILAAAREQGAEGEINAVYWRNKVHIVSSQMKSATDVETAIFHEALGHYGARALFGKEWGIKATQLYLAMGGEKGVRDFARKAGVNMDAYFKSAQKMPDNAEKALYLVDELLAHMQGKRATMSLPQRAVDAVKALIGEARQWLSRNGFMELSKLTDYDLAALLKRMRESATQAKDTAGKDKPMFMLGVKDDNLDNVDFANKALAYLAENDELFRYPVSKQISLRGVMADIASDTRFVGNDTRHDERRESGADRRYMFETVDKKPFYVYERGVRDDAEIWIDVSRLSEGDQGGAIYAAIMNYAHNSGKVFIGDPAGLSEAAIIRRTSHMLSAALRYGKTDFMEPSPRQRKGIPEKGIAPLEWRGSDLDKLKSLINTFTKTTHSQFPQLKEYSYDFGRDRFIDSRGRPLDAARLDVGKTHPDARAARAGQATLRRAIFIQSLTSSPSSQRPQLLEQLIARSHALVTQGDLGAMFSRSPSATADDAVSRDETASDTADKADAASIVGDRFALPAETRRDKARRKIQDDAIRIQKVQDAIVEQGGEIAEESNIAEAIKLYPGRLAERLADLNKKIVEPLLERMAKTGITMDDVGLYMYALHAKERNAEIAKIRKDLPNDGKPGNSGSGMTDAVADEIIKQAQAHPQFKSIQSASNVLNKIIAARLTMLVKEGVMSEDQADAYRAQYKHYVPLKGFEKADVNGVPQGAGRGISTGRKIDFRALGRKSMAKDIFQNIIRDAGSAMMLAEKAKVGRVARAFVEANPDAKLWSVDKIPKDRHFSKGQSVHNVYYHGSLVADFAHPKDANDYANYLLGKPNTNKDDVEVKSVKLNPNGLVVLKDAQFDPNEEIMFIEGSDVVRIQFTDPLMTRAYNRLWNNGVSDALKLLNDYNSLLRQMYTQKNPAWFILNAFRDVQAVVPYLAGEKGAKFAFKAVGNMLGAKKAAWNFFHKKPLSKEWADVMERYRRAGGTVGFAYVGDVEAKTLELEGALSRYTSWNSTIQNLKQGEIKKGMHDVLTKTLNSKAFAWIEALNTSFENMSRLATFKAAIDSGLSDHEGAMLSKHVTVNFNTRGEWGPNMNAVWLFSNASVQGSRNIGHALLYSKHKGQVWALAGGLAAVGVMAGLMGDDDDDLVRDDERGKSLIFKFGDSTIKWPMPYGWGFFGGLGQLIAQTMKHPENHDKIAIEMADLTMQHFGVIGNPFAGASNDLVGTVNMLPTAAKPWAQAAVNRSSFGGPLYPESPFDETTPDSEKAWRSTKGSAYDMTAKWLNDVSGGDSVQEGFVDWSPESIKLGVTTITGGVGRLVADLFSLPFKATSDEDMSPKDFPVIKNFIGEISTDEHKRRFYEQSSKAKEAYIIYKNYQKKGDVESADAYLAENNAIVALGSMVESYQKTLKQLRENEDRVKNDASLSGDRRKTELKLIESRIIGTTKEFNDKIKNINSQ